MIPRRLLLVACILIAGSLTTTANDKLLDDISVLAEDFEGASEEQRASILDRMPESTPEVRSTILSNLRDDSTKDEQLIVYAWVAGHAKDAQFIPDIAKLAKNTDSDDLHLSSCRSLTVIGGDKAAKALHSLLDHTKDKDRRFTIFYQLGQLQYEPALKEMVEVLQCDPKSLYWQPVFVFGTMGDKAVPFLLEHIDSDDQNIRYNAVHVLGQWLIPTEAAKPFRERFWKDDDQRVRGMILGSLPDVTPLIDDNITFAKEVVAKAKNKQFVEHSQSTLNQVEKIKGFIVANRADKRDARDEFNAEYKKAYDSMGHDGDIDILRSTSTIKDEARLKKLRERILQRGSDEAFSDYQMVNRIISLNRLLGVNP